MLSRPRFLALGLSLVFVWILIAYHSLGNTGFEVGSEKGDASEWATRISKEDFIEAAISSAVEDDFDDSYIAAMCGSQEWDNTVVFDCRGMIGGIGMMVHASWICLKLTICRKHQTGVASLLEILDIRWSWTHNACH
jgi:hypothetical protein